MPQVAYSISGIVTQSDGSTAIASINVSVINKTTGESHNGSDSGFEDLITNSAGEYQVNLASYTNEYNNGDSIDISASHSTHGTDIETTEVVTINGGETVNLVLISEDLLIIVDAINEVGERVDHRRNASTYEEGTIESETATNATLTMSLQIVNDERILMKWGEVKQGEAIGYFKGKESIRKGDLIRVPITTGDWWRIQDTPVLIRKGGQPASFEAKMVRIDDT